MVPGNPDLDAGGKKLTERWAFGDQYFIRVVLLSASSIEALKLYFETGIC